VWQCVEAGLVDGSKIFVDSSLVDANASNNSVIDTRSLKVQLQESYKKLEARLRRRARARILRGDTLKRTDVISQPPIRMRDCKSGQAQTFLSGSSGRGWEERSDHGDGDDSRRCE